MKARINFESAPEAYAAMAKLQLYVSEHVDAALRELVYLRASQINGCAFCIAMHVTEARKRGEHEDRISLVSVWREAPIYSERERAALAWTEAVTVLSDGHVPDDVYQMARAQFSERELADLTVAIVMINGWNRLCVSFRALPKVAPELIQATAA